MKKINNLLADLQGRLQEGRWVRAGNALSNARYWVWRASGGQRREQR